MTSPRKCPDCGAPVPAGRPARCEFCGSDLSGPAPAPAPAGGSARLRAIRETAAWAQAQRHTPANRPTAVGAVASLLFAGLFCVVPAFMLYSGRRMGGGAWPFMLVGGLLMLFGVAIVLGVLNRALRVLREPVRRLAAVVVDKRTEVSGGGRNSSSTTSYYVTLEDDAGQRVELSAAGELFGVLTAGDAGVAFVLIDDLLEFTRITIV